MEDRAHRIAVIGAGWAGAVAALRLAEAGLRPQVFEAGAIPGGRARRVEHGKRHFDNGQHLLIGAYHRTLSWIEQLGGPGGYRRLPLSILPAPGLPKALSLQVPSGLPAPWHLLFALLTAKPLSLIERGRALLSSRALLKHAPSAQQTVAQYLAEVPSALRYGLFEPLCIGALNTPPERASALVFHEVLSRALSQARDGDFIIPRIDLSALLPEAALDRVKLLGGEVRLGCPVISLATEPRGSFRIQHRHGEASFDCLLLAVGPQHLPRLLRSLPEAAAIVEALEALEYQAIATVQFEFSHGLDHESDAIRLLDGSPAQWLFTQRTSEGSLRASLVLSAVDADTLALNQAELAERCWLQLGRSYRLPRPSWQQVVIEKRATWSCTPEQQKCLSSLPRSLAEGRLQLAGDWTVPNLPATLEAAIISAERAADHLLKNLV